jgi:pyridinium-3,5-biscarboxylic acid mononucleotide sulfurtransferase
MSTTFRYLVAQQGWEDGPMEATLAAKKARLEQSVASLERVVVAYSGGVDSALVAAVAHDVLGEGALAVTAVSPSLASRERRAAAELAECFGWHHRLVGTHEVAREEYAVNDPDRCYWCKTELFEVLGPIAAERGARIAVGTNLDDLSDYRPGLRAATESDVATPLADAGLSKDEVRALSTERGLPTATKPASPCLASRFAYGVRVTPEGLRRIDAAEEAVRAHGFEVFRVRDHGDRARLEVLVEEIPRALDLRGAITDELAALGFREVTIDPKGFRSGSLNEVLKAPTIKLTPT